MSGVLFFNIHLHQTKQLNYMKNIFTRLNEKQITYAVCSSMSTLAASDMEIGTEHYILMYYKDGNKFRNPSTSIYYSKHGVKSYKRGDNRVEHVFSKAAMVEYDMSNKECKLFHELLQQDKFDEVLNSEEGQVWELKGDSFKEYINNVDYMIKSNYSTTLFK